MLLFFTIGIAITALAHTWPAPFLLDWLAADHALWSMPPAAHPTVYLTYDDGPNPATTPDLLDVLQQERVDATFFVIDAHVREDTAHIVARTFREGHAVGLHSATRGYLLDSPEALAERLTRHAQRIETLAGASPCRAFRPHAGWRSGRMYEGIKALDYRLVGWGWMLWDFNWFRARDAGSTFGRIAPRVEDGDIIVMHDGDESAPERDQRHTVEATRRLIPELRARGFGFGKVC